MPHTQASISDFKSNWIKPAIAGHMEYWPSLFGVRWTYAEMEERSSNQQRDSAGQHNPHQINWPSCPAVFFTHSVIATVVECPALKKRPSLPDAEHPKPKHEI